MNAVEKRAEDPTLLVRRCIDCCHGQRRTAIDVGAYAGLWATQLSQEFHYVMAFEPIEDYFVLLRSNTQTMVNVTCRAEAVGDREGSGVMRKKDFDFPAPDAWTLLNGPAAIGQIGSELNNHAVVPITTIDALNLDGIDFIKINTNGGEYEVVVGAFETIRGEKPLVLVNEDRDPHRKASRLLRYYGMRELLVWDRNYLFGW